VRMAATRTRFESLVEWVVAAAFLAAVLGIGSIVVREFRTVSALTPVIAREPVHTSPVPAGVPSRAVSVPMLLLHGGKEVRVGDTLAAITTRFTREAETGGEILDRAPNGERLTRFYEHEGTEFVLVFEPFEAGGVLRVAGIYLK
jgi:hypothetical protein